MSNGKILLVGFGPGSAQHMSYRAREAIAESDVVIGYSTYIKLVADLLDGKDVIRKGMTEEIDRCIEAYEQAKLGKTVALVSSGDIGVYGMAGPTYEVLLQSGWTPESGIAVEVVPGSTALSACASLVGAPLTHDFSSISLSDLLTPWPTIAKRLDAAAKSDFVIALYNPKSGRRTGQIVEAQRLILKYRPADTPVAIVKSAYRDKQDIQLVRLDEMKDCNIGMLTTVLIGNSTTFMQAGLMITPRGYANKYADLTGEALAGEKKGRSLTMGLLGWKACVREYIRANVDASLRDIAAHFNSPMGEILSAISEASEGPAGNDFAGDYEVQPIAQEALDTSLQEAQQWGKLRAVVRSEAGAISELMIEAKECQFRGDWLNIENAHFHLHINWAQLKQAWLVRRANTYRGIYFTDVHGETIFNLSMVRQEGEFDPNAKSKFDSAWLSLGSVS